MGEDDKKKLRRDIRSIKKSCGKSSVNFNVDKVLFSINFLSSFCLLSFSDHDLHSDEIFMENRTRAEEEKKSI